MTIKEIKAMFAVGQKWHATRKDERMVINGKTGSLLLEGKHRDEIREVHHLGSSEIVFLLPDGKKYYTPWPKASEVIEARSGFLKFKICDGRVEVTLERTLPA